MELVSCRFLSIARVDGENRLPGGQSFGSRVVQHYELDYMLSTGTGSIVTDDKREPIAAGRLFFRIPGTVVEGFPPYSCYYIQFEAAAPLPLSASCFADLPGQLPLLERIYRGFLSQDPLFDYLFTVTVHELFYQLMLSRSNQPFAASLTPTLDYLEQHLHEEDVSLDALAAHSGYSKYRFAHLFRQQFHTSPMRHLQNLRIAAACRLLVETSFPVNEIQRRCGYTDECAFFRAFKNRTGLSPLAYRRRYRYQGGGQ